MNERKYNFQITLSEYYMEQICESIRMIKGVDEIEEVPPMPKTEADKVLAECFHRKGFFEASNRLERFFRPISCLTEPVSLADAFKAAWDEWIAEHPYIGDEVKED